MKPTKEQVHTIFRDLVSTGTLGHDKAVVVYMKEILKHRLLTLSKAFADDTLHAIAIKTCSEETVLQQIVEYGFGLEAASIEEMWLAKQAGVETSKLVFDSPVKTHEEIQVCHEAFAGALINANSLQELERYPKEFNCRVGLRINPLVQSKAEKLLDVANHRSKFGVPIDQREAIVQACLLNKVTCLHMHIGSGISDFSPNLEGVRKLHALAEEINSKAGKDQIVSLDIGGGIQFDLEETSPSDYAEALAQVPGLSKFQLITEFGAYIHKHAAFAVSLVEYVIPGEPNLAYIHLGADMFLRKVYSELNITYPISVLQEIPDSEQLEYSIVGPLCFGGDVLEESIKLPKLKEGDVLFIHDVGANTLSMWSQHCSRTKPPFLLV